MVIAIILVVSVLGLAVYRGSGGRQVNEASRLVQAELVGARDAASRSGRPAGIRLLPDPALTMYSPNGQVDPKAILAANRMVPIAAAPNYSEGGVSIYQDGAGGSSQYSATVRTVNGYPGCPCLVLEQSVLDNSGAPNPPTNWFWNVRVGDQIQIGGSGPWMTVVGPMVQANPEQFVNIGKPGTALPQLNGPVPCEYLLLVNGRDDNGNGWIDDGFDGIDNDAPFTMLRNGRLVPNSGSGIIDNGPIGNQPFGEWEIETWPDR